MFRLRRARQARSNSLALSKLRRCFPKSNGSESRLVFDQSQLHEHAVDFDFFHLTDSGIFRRCLFIQT